MTISHCCRAVVLLTVMGVAPPALAITIGQTDDFQDGTTQGWTEGPASPNAPTNVASGGPAGAGDSYLEATSSFPPGGAGSRMASYNRDQWAGDYTSAGVTAISLDLINQGATDLNIRLAMVGDGGTFATTDSFFLGTGSGWQSAVFSITASDLTAVSDSICCSPGTDAAATLSSVFEFRIISAAGPNFRGDNLTGSMGIDNVAAVPEPETLAMVLLGTLGLALGGKTRKRA